MVKRARGGGQGALAPAPAEKCPQLWKQFILPFVGVQDNSSWMAGPILTNYTLLESSRGALQFDVGHERGACAPDAPLDPPLSRALLSLTSMPNVEYWILNTLLSSTITTMINSIQVGPIRDPVWAILRGFKGLGTNAIYGPFVGQGARHTCNLWPIRGHINFRGPIWPMLGPWGGPVWGPGVYRGQVHMQFMAHSWAH